MVVKDPLDRKDIVANGMVSRPPDRPPRGDVLFMIEVDPQRGPALSRFRAEAERTVSALPGVAKVTAVLTGVRKGLSRTYKAAAATQPCRPRTVWVKIRNWIYR
ncbi:MAG: iron-sulfur cluster assembly protein [Alphaproteobacteria bacterium]